MYYGELMIKDNVVGDGIGYVELVGLSGDDKSIVDAARVSFGKGAGHEFTDRDYRLLKYLLRMQHYSPFEHNQLRFRIKAPLFVHAHFVKHRVGVSINSQSGRYVEMDDEFYIPVRYRKQSESNKQASTDEEVGLCDIADDTYRKAISYSYTAYQHLLQLGVSKEQSRGILPLATYTSFICTFNLRSLLHFVELRSSADAQWETRQYSNAIKDIAAFHFPHTFRAIKELGQ